MLYFVHPGIKAMTEHALGRACSPSRSFRVHCTCMQCSPATVLQGADRVEEVKNRRQYEAALSVAVELYPDIHDRFVAAQAANAAMRAEMARLRAEVTRLQLQLTGSDAALSGLQSEQRCTAHSLLQWLEASQPGHDCVHDIMELLKVQHPAAAASFLNASQE